MWRGGSRAWQVPGSRVMSGILGGVWGRVVAVLMVLLLAGGLMSASLTAEARSSRGAESVGADEILHQELPPEAQKTLALILQGGPFPYAKDGTVFGNREGRLPRQRRGYYTEYTVKTPRIRHRGPRRIVAGGREGRFEVFYYTADHYETFRRIRMP